MSFQLSSAVDRSKVFIIRKADVDARWDPFYFRPELVSLEKRVRKATSNRLRDFVVSMAGGATPSTQEAETHYTETDDGIPFIRVQNLSTTGRLNLDDCKRITRATHEGLLRRSRLSGGELLVKITGVGRMAVASVVPDEFEGNINQHIVAIKTSDRQTSDTLAAYLNLDLAERLASRRATGGTRPALDYPALLSIPVLFDKRIPAMMNAAVDAFLAKRSEASRLLATVDDVLLTELGIPQKPEPPNTIESRMFRRAFGHVSGQRLDPLYYQGDIYWFVRDVACDLVRLGGLADYFLTGFAAGRGDQGEEDAGIIQIRPTNISDDRDLIFRRNVYLSPAEIESRPADLLKRGEALFNNTNSQDLVGKTAFYDLEGQYFSSNHITRIGTKAAQLDPIYLAYILNLYQRKRVFFKVCTNWNNQSGVGVDVLQQMPVPLPRAKAKTECLARQHEIVEKLDAIREQSRQMRSKAAADLDRAKRDIETLILGKEAAT